MKQFILKLPEYEKINREVEQAIKEVNGQFSPGRIIGTESIAGYELKLVLCDATSEQLNDLFIAFDLDWAVLAEEGGLINEDSILFFMNDFTIYDEDGEILSSEPRTNLDSLQTYAGRSWAHA